MKALLNKLFNRKPAKTIDQLYQDCVTYTIKRSLTHKDLPGIEIWRDEKVKALYNFYYGTGEF